MQKIAVKSPKFRIKPVKSLTNASESMYNSRVRKIYRAILSLRRKYKSCFYIRAGKTTERR